MVGIDKLQLWSPLNAFSVRDASHTHFGYNLSTRQGSQQLPYLFTDGQGKRVVAQSIYHNSDIAQYSINAKGLLVQLNPSKKFHPYKLTTTGEKFSQVVTQLDQELDRIGISLSTDCMKMIRVDLARQCEMSNPFPNYISAFLMMKAKRAKNQIQYPNGLVIGNSQWETISYDKETELTQQQHLTIEEHNLMRVETRWLNGKTIEAQFGTNSLDEFQDLSPDNLRDLYVGHLNNRIFPKMFDKHYVSVDFETEVKKMRYLHGKCGPSWLFRYMALNSDGLEHLLVGFGGIEQVRKAMLEFLPRQTASDQIRRLKDLISIKSMMDHEAGLNSPSAMLFELQEKFAA